MNSFLVGAILWGTYKSGILFRIGGAPLTLIMMALGFLSICVAFLWRLRKMYYLDPVRIIGWVMMVALLTAPLAATVDKFFYTPTRLEEIYQAREKELPTYLGKQGLDTLEIAERLDQLRAEKATLFQVYPWHHYLLRQLILWSVLGFIYAAILGLLARGGGT
ncbi:MAG: hypothetical protein ACUVRD_07860 [Bacteroidia bacterium]